MTAGSPGQEAEQMDQDNDGPLVEALARCGIDAALVEMEWDDLCREEVVTFSGAHYSHETLARLADLYLTFPTRFVFPSDDLQNAFDRAVLNTPAMQKAREDGARERRTRLKARGLANFQPFDPSRESLTAFTARAEAACGFDGGAM